ncbi:hypothetical protein CTT31_19350 [Pseudoalteromonas maricaloris]|nr:hypothetical protein CTT31_19350 [Pseudoalteromonas flavipulchra]
MVLLQIGFAYWKTRPFLVKLHCLLENHFHFISDRFKEKLIPQQNQAIIVDVEQLKNMPDGIICQCVVVDY